MPEIGRAASNKDQRGGVLEALACARWTRERFEVPARVLARRLLGAVLARKLDDGSMLAGRIVETEAYVGGRDAASHAYGLRRTPRNEAMYARGGTAYVYFTYGMHYCFNVVCAREGVPEAVLIRALEPVLGLEHMARHRNRPLGAEFKRLRDLCSGPARLCQALAIEREFNGEDLVTSPRLFIAAPASGTSRPRARGAVIASPRVGIDSAAKRDHGRGQQWVDKPLRFSIKGHACVSVKPASSTSDR